MSIWSIVDWTASPATPDLLGEIDFLLAKGSFVELATLGHRRQHAGNHLQSADQDIIFSTPKKILNVLDRYAMLTVLPMASWRLAPMSSVQRFEKRHTSRMYKVCRE